MRAIKSVLAVLWIAWLAYASFTLLQSPQIRSCDNTYYSCGGTP